MPTMRGQKGGAVADVGGKRVMPGKIPPLERLILKGLNLESGCRYDGSNDAGG
jgi:hypothetical protein